MDLSLGSEDMKNFLDALKDSNLNKPGAFEGVMGNIVNHIWTHNYSSISKMVFILRLMPFVAMILLWNDICNVTLILNIVLQATNTCYEVIQIKAKGTRKYFSELNNYLEFLGSVAANTWLVSYMLHFNDIMSLPNTKE